MDLAGHIKSSQALGGSSLRTGALGQIDGQIRETAQSIVFVFDIDIIFVIDSFIISPNPYQLHMYMYIA